MNKTEEKKLDNVPVQSEEEMQQFVSENMLLVPKNQLTKFKAMKLNQQVSRINFYKNMIAMRADAIEKNKLVNKVKDLFEKRKATTKDAEEVIEYCRSFIDSFRAREIARLDEEIRKLELMKESL